MAEEKNETIIEVTAEEKKPKKSSKKVDHKKGIVSNCKKLNVRNSGNNDGKIVGVISKDDPVSVDLEKSTEDYYKIETKSGLIGFCKKDYIILN